MMSSKRMTFKMPLLSPAIAARGVVLAALLVLEASGSPRAQEIVDHPSKLTYPPFEFTPPEASPARRVLPCGVPVYIVEDHELPLVQVSVLVRAGAWLEPPEKPGLASVVGRQMSSAGTESLAPADFDEEVAFLAANLGISLGDTDGRASLNCLSKDLERALDLFVEMIRKPRFDPERLELWRTQELQDLARRNDDTQSIEAREWERLLLGDGYYTTDRVTQAVVEGITRDDLVAFHKRWIHPSQLIIAVSGDVDADRIAALLERRLADWAAEPSAGPPPAIPAPTRDVAAGLFLVDKKGVNQGRVRLGHRAPRRDHPDYAPLVVMNDILGGGGFTSRIMARVRSDKGLAYSAGSRLQLGVYNAGEFRCFFQSKSPSVAEAISIVLEEVRKIREGLVSDEELATAVNAMIGSLPQYFSTSGRTALTFAEDELTGRAPDFWRTFRRRLEAVTKEDVRRVAQEHLHPDRLAILVVGDAEAMLAAGSAGETSGPGASLRGLAGAEGVRSIPLPDPLTLVYPTQ